MALWNLELQTYHSWAIYLALLAAALLIATISTPLWIWLDPEGGYVGIGLFYRKGHDMDSATPFPVTNVQILSDKTLDTSHWDAMAALEVMATCFAILLVVALIYYRRRFSMNEGLNFYYYSSFCMTIAAWMFNVSGLIVFALFHGDAMTNAPKDTDDSFSWGAFMAFFSAFIHFWLAIIVYTKFREEAYTQTIIPAAADPKMELYPSTQNGMTNRFLPTTPYSVGKPEEPTNRPAILSADDLNDRRNLISQSTRRPQDYGNSAFTPNRFQPVVRELGNRQNSTREDLSNGVQGIEEERVFRRIDSKRPSDKRDGDFMVPARHSPEREVYRNERYLSHTNKPSDETNDGPRRLGTTILEESTKYNPLYMYRPYSEQN